MNKGTLHHGESGLALGNSESMELLPPEYADVLAGLVKQVMSPVIEAMAKMLEHNTKALDQLAATQTVQNDRMEALERQIRLNTLVTPQQVRYMNDAIKKRARELLIKRELDDMQAVRKLGNAIRKSVLARYGIAALYEIPKHEYTVATSQINMWNDAMCIMDVVKEARKRNEAEVETV